MRTLLANIGKCVDELAAIVPTPTSSVDVILRPSPEKKTKPQHVELSSSALRSGSTLPPDTVDTLDISGDAISRRWFVVARFILWKVS